MKHLMYAAATLLLFLGGPVFADTHYHIEVDGIVCPFCMYGIEKKLTKLEGVVEIRHNLEKGQFFIKVADGSSLTEEEVRDAVTEAGFTLRSFTVVEQENDS
ncbi:MAG: heavy-metal-associated domain-containing protein [Candidatus Tectomicrobia bacterium]